MFVRVRNNGNVDENADLTCDGKVDILDLGLMADNFGKAGDP